MNRHIAVVYLALFATCGLLIAGSLAGAKSGDVAPANSPRVCFSAAKWGPAPDAIRPCVKVTRIFEDGSFSYAVTDADGTVRYTAGVGALDR